MKFKHWTLLRESEEHGFHRALDQPGSDPFTKLVYADWLEERGNPIAHYIRLKHEYEHGKADYQRLAFLEREIRDFERKHHKELTNLPIVLFSTHPTNYRWHLGPTHKERTERTDYHTPGMAHIKTYITNPLRTIPWRARDDRPRRALIGAYAYGNELQNEIFDMELGNFRHSGPIRDQGVHHDVLYTPGQDFHLKLKDTENDRVYTISSSPGAPVPFIPMSHDPKKGYGAIHMPNVRV